jgi:tetratricopeptide (TPR) repeat protein
MSSIHDALRRAERDRETRPAGSAGSLVLSRGTRPVRRWLWTAAAAVGAIFLALALYSWLDFRSSPVRHPQVNESSETHTLASETMPEDLTLSPGFDTLAAESLPPQEELKLSRMARVLHQAGKFPEARALYEEAIRLRPDLVEAKNNLGVVQLALKDYIAAENTFHDVTGMRPDYADAHYNLACVYALTGRIREALSALSLAVELAPGAREWALVDRDLDALREFPDFGRVVSMGE